MTQAEIDALFSRGGDVTEEKDETEEEVILGSKEWQAPRQTQTSSFQRRRRKEPVKKFSKVHDFKNPKLFSKEQIRQVHAVYDTYAKHMSSFMSGVLRTDCALTLDSIPEELKYMEYNNALPETIMMGVFSAEPIEGNFLYNISIETAYTIIDRLLGGTGDDVVMKDEFSEIEQRLLEKFFRQTTGFIKEAWGNIIPDVDPRFRQIVTNARLSQLMPLGETVLVLTLTVKIKEHIGNMSICVPCLNLEKILGKTSSYAFYNRRREDTNVEENKKNLMEHVRTSRLDIAGILGTTTLKLRDLLYLQTGDVIALDKNVESPITVKIGSHDFYAAEIGTKKNKISVKIKNIL